MNDKREPPYIEENRSPHNTSVIELLERSKSFSDERQIKSIDAAYAVIKSLSLPARSTAASVGAGRPSRFFWPDQTFIPIRHYSGKEHPHIAHAWEKILVEFGVHVHVFEPEYECQSLWRQFSMSQITVPVGDEAFFQNSKLAAESVDIIVCMNLFGTPTLIGNTRAYTAIMRKMADLLKDKSYIIAGDQWLKDREITVRNVSMLEQMGYQLSVVKKYEKTDIPWTVFQVFKKS